MLLLSALLLALASTAVGQLQQPPQATARAVQPVALRGEKATLFVELSWAADAAYRDGDLLFYEVQVDSDSKAELLAAGNVSISLGAVLRSNYTITVRFPSSGHIRARLGGRVDGWMGPSCP